jgi:hypothetical protein
VAEDWFTQQISDPPVSMPQVATAPDGVPVYSQGGKFFTQNGDGSYTQQFQGGLPDWLAQATGQGQAAASGGGGAPTLNTSDPASVNAYIAYYANQPGANPSLKNDPGYWAGKISSGELGSDPNYIVGKFMTPEGAPAGAGGGNASVAAAGQQFQQAPQAAQRPIPPPITLANINAPAAVQAQQVTTQPIAAPGTITPERISAGTITPQSISGSTVQGPQALNAQTLANPTGFQGVSKADLEADPGYQYRLQQAQQALENTASAKGVARGSNAWKALMSQASDMAAQQYQQTYANKFGEYQSGVQNQLAYTGANNAATAQAYGLTNQYQQNAALANQANALQAGQFNAGLNYNAQAANVGNALNAAQFNSGQGYNAQAQNIGNTIGVNQFNAGQNLQGQLANQGANLNAGQFNANMDFNTQQANNTNALNAYNSSNNAGLGVYQANIQNALGQGQLGLGYQTAANNYGLGLGNLGLATQGQNYNQGLSTFNANQGANQQAFNNNYSLAQLGLQANGQVGNAGSNYANQAGNLYTGIGNAQGAGSIAAGNAWSSTLGNLSNYAQQQALLNSGNQSGGFSSTPYFAY